MANEVRLIDAEKLKRQLIEGDGHDDDRFTEGYNFAINEIKEYIDNMPTIETELVKHGRWKLRCYGDYPYCSNCNNEPKSREITLFCPNCGARMDGDDDEI